MNEMLCGGEPGDEKPGWTIKMSERIEPRTAKAVGFHFCSDEPEKAVRDKIESSFGLKNVRDTGHRFTRISAVIDENTRDTSAVCRPGQPFKILISDESL